MTAKHMRFSILERMQCKPQLVALPSHEANSSSLTTPSVVKVVKPQTPSHVPGGSTHTLLLGILARIPQPFTICPNYNQYTHGYTFEK